MTTAPQEGQGTPSASGTNSCPQVHLNLWAARFGATQAACLHFGHVTFISTLSLSIFLLFL
jgi:hypothetical protein